MRRGKASPRRPRNLPLKTRRTARARRTHDAQRPAQWFRAAHLPKIFPEISTLFLVLLAKQRGNAPQWPAMIRTAVTQLDARW